MLDLKEFRAALKYEGIHASPETELECFNEIDTDHSGLISFDEFLVALRVKIHCHISVKAHETS